MIIKEKHNHVKTTELKFWRAKRIQSVLKSLSTTVSWFMQIWSTLMQFELALIWFLDYVVMMSPKRRRNFISLVFTYLNK